jgi:LysR family glycine cleavage system transcriptional activator
LHDGSPDLDDSCPDWSMWLAARGLKGVDGMRGPRFNQSSLVIEGRRERPRRGARQAHAGRRRPGGGTPGRAACRSPPPSDFAYYLVHPKAKGRLPQVKAFVSWIEAEALAHEQALLAIDNGAGI